MIDQKSHNVSICLPTLNRPMYLQKTIRSVIEQTYPFFELIVLDNHSDIDIKPYVDCFHDTRLKYYRSERRLTLAESLNRSFKFLQSEFFMILHDDDLLCSQFIERNIMWMNENLEIPIIASSMKSINDSDEIGKDVQPLAQDIFFSKNEYFKSYYSEGIFLPMPTVFFRSKFLIKNKVLFKSDVGPNLDQYFWFELNLLDSCKFLLKKDTFYMYRIHSGQSANWDLQELLLDMKAYSLAFKNALLDICSKIDARKKSQLIFLINYSIENNTNEILKRAIKEKYFNLKTQLLFNRLKCLFLTSRFFNIYVKCFK